MNLHELKLPLKKHTVLLVLLLAVTSCKTKQSVVSEADTSLHSKEIIQKYKQQNSLNFKTLHIKGNTSYQIFNVNLDIRIKKDEIILVSGRFLGTTIVKAKITPDYVSYYNKWESEYFEGDYDILSEFLGTELDFQKVQNLLLGRTLDELDREKFVFEVENNLYKLSSNRSDLNKSYYFEPDNFRLVKQFVEQKHENRSAFVEYSNYKEQDNSILPFFVLINSLNKNEKNEFKVEYKSMEFNTEISFPYDIPSGYREIKID